MPSQLQISAIEKAIGYQFRNQTWLVDALTHPDLFDGAGHFRELAWMGDAILNGTATQMIAIEFWQTTRQPAGTLAQIRSKVISNDALHRLAHHLGIAAIIQLNSAPQEVRTKPIADVMEAIIGAIHVDCELRESEAKQVAINFINTIFRDKTIDWSIDPKTVLNELIQGHRWSVKYQATKDGEVFTVSCKVDRIGLEQITTIKKSRSKRAAESGAAELMLKKLGKGNP